MAAGRLEVDMLVRMFAVKVGGDTVIRRKFDIDIKEWHSSCRKLVSELDGFMQACK